MTLFAIGAIMIVHPRRSGLFAAVLFAVGFAMTVSAFGQTYPEGCIQGFMNLCPPSMRSDYHSAGGLDRAMKICDKHEIPSNQIHPVNPPRDVPGSYPKAWELCYKVRTKWNESDAARQERERQAQEERDRAFVRDVAEGK